MSLLKQYFTKLSVFVFLALSLVGLMLPSQAYAQGRGGFIPDSTRLCGGNPCPVIANPESVEGDRNSLANLIIGIARFVTFVVGAVAVLFLVYGGVLFVTDNGDGNSAKKGKLVLINAVIGLIIAIVAYTIVGLVGNVVQGDLAGDLVTGGN